MRLIVTLSIIGLFTISAGPVLAGTALPANLVWNGGFEAYVPGGAVLLPGSPADRSLGVGHQVLGCGHLAGAVWQEGCDGKPRDPAAEVQAIAANPNDEIAYWTTDGYERGDLAIVSPAQQNVWYAQNWGVYPSGTVAFRDVDQPVNLEREAVIGPGNQMLYQTFAATSTHTIAPMGLVRDVTFMLEAGNVGGTFVVVLDSFPLESVADWPQAFYNYQLSMPAATWTVDAQTGLVTIDPLKGSLSGPANGAYILPTLDPHPTTAQWNAATPEERRAILMELRPIQITFWNLPTGTVLDDVTMTAEA